MASHLNLELRNIKHQKGSLGLPLATTYKTMKNIEGGGIDLERVLRQDESLQRIQEDSIQIMQGQIKQNITPDEVVNKSYQ